MKKSVGVLTLVLVPVIAAGVLMAAADGPPPPWAYPTAPPAPAGGGGRGAEGGGGGRGAAPDPTATRTVPGSSVALTNAYIADGFMAFDWFPNAHPPMPDVIAKGRKPDLRGCAFCHLANGQGRPENASVAGLSIAYIVQQMADFKNGDRKSSEPRMGPPAAMINMAKAATDEEVLAAAKWFSSLAPKPWVKVVETDTVPKTRVQQSLRAIEGGGTEPLGTRIIELPEDAPRADLRDPSSGWIAYVPKGSIEKGKALVTTGGGGKTVQCTICHGADLKGLGPVPPLAGRSPSYMVRQMYDMQHGNRKGPWAALMKGPIEKLTEEDMLTIAAYAASLAP